MNLYKDDRQLLIDYAIEALKKGTLIIHLVSVSRTRESRKLKFYMMKNDRLINLNREDIFIMAGCNKTGRIKGCGMDMLLHAQDRLWVSLIGATVRNSEQYSTISFE